ncbi:phospholipase D family protein [Desulfosporosinus sp. SB140]|uniref:phospholipase D family nuclease n=1 Tax=Desulfosporosinus paludis TaxID=3115649 RepID=UPI0038904098
MNRKILILGLALFISFTLVGCNSNTASLSATQVLASTAPSSQVEYYFTRADQHPEKALESQINTAKSTLDIAIYSLTKKDIVDAIIAAKKRGVSVRIITDRIEARTKAQSSELALLKNAGITIKENSHSGLMHMKVSIIEKSVVTTGSYNYTQNASTENDEVLVIIHDPSIAAKWSDEFQQMWDDTNNYSEI